MESQQQDKFLIVRGKVANIFLFCLKLKHLWNSEKKGLNCLELREFYNSAFMSENFYFMNSKKKT